MENKTQKDVVIENEAVMEEPSGEKLTLLIEEGKVETATASGSIEMKTDQELPLDLSCKTSKNADEIIKNVFKDPKPPKRPKKTKRHHTCHRHCKKRQPLTVASRGTQTDEDFFAYVAENSIPLDSRSSETITNYEICARIDRIFAKYEEYRLTICPLQESNIDRETVNYEYAEELVLRAGHNFDPDEREFALLLGKAVQCYPNYLRHLIIKYSDENGIMDGEKFEEFKLELLSSEQDGLFPYMEETCHKIVANINDLTQ